MDHPERNGAARVAGPRRVSGGQRHRERVHHGRDSEPGRDDAARPAGTRHILYNTHTTLEKNGGAIGISLSALYAQRALVPASPWLDSTAPGAPGVTVNSRTVLFTPAAGEAARWWYVRAKVGGSWVTKVMFGDQRSLTLSGDPERVLLNAVDQAGNLSLNAEWKRAEGQRT
ncbi:hypothetical protein BH11GEM2_BH11GEM2_27710 [soil metagenome]